MAYTRYNRLLESEFDNIVCRKVKIQDRLFDQWKFERHDTYQNDEKITTNFQSIDKEDVINKAFVEENLLKIDGHSSF